MYNYTGYGMNPYQQQLAQNRIAQMEQPAIMDADAKVFI